MNVNSPQSEPWQVSPLQCGFATQCRRRAIRDYHATKPAAGKLHNMSVNSGDVQAGCDSLGSR